MEIEGGKAENKTRGNNSIQIEGKKERNRARFDGFDRNFVGQQQDIYNFIKHDGELGGI